MAIAITLEQYLSSHDIEYDLMTHPRTVTSTRTAQAGHVSGERLAKAVVVKDDERFLMAVLPASCRVEMGRLGGCLKARVGLATERELDGLFADCELGAVPPVGPAYGLDVIVDDRLSEQPEVYFEGGDHETLVHVSAEQFRRLMADASHGRFSRHD